MSQPVLSLKNVTIAQEGKIILSNVNLEVNHGEFIYIIGKTGSGKSSFMKALYADLPLTEGEGRIVDFDLVTLKEDDIPFLRRKIGFVFQDFKLLPDRSVKDNLLFVLKATGWKDNSEIQNKIDEVLDNKVDGLNEHTSQMYEWLPWIGNGGKVDPSVPTDPAARKAWLKSRWMSRNMPEAQRAGLAKWYSPEKAASFKFAESFEITKE